MEDVPEQLHSLPRVVDFRAQHTPGRIFAYLPKGNTVEDGFSELTYAALAKAIDVVAWWLDETFDKQDTTIPYIGANDVRYGLIVFAAIKTGRAAMIPLMYNTLEGQVKLLSAYNCKAVVASAGHEHYWKAVLDNDQALRLIQMPSVDEIMNAPNKPYAYEKTYSEVKGDAMVILQTSGTTGNPKPLRWSNRWLTLMIERMVVSKQSSPDNWLGIESSMYHCWTPNTLPMSWGMGIFHLILFPLIYENIVTLFPSSIPHPVPAEHIHRMIQAGPKGPTNGAMFVPETLKEIARNPTHLQSLKQYSWVGYVGAPLDQSVGDTLASLDIRVQSILGQMDCGGYPMLVSHRDDWNLYRIREMQGFHLDKFSDDSWELCVTKQPDEDRPAFLLNPGTEVYRTKDLWRKAPNHEGYWIMAGRVDDFVKLANLTKFNAIEMEGIIERHTGVEKVIVAGDARRSAFVLLQPTSDFRALCGNDNKKIVDAIWPQLEEVNRHVHSDAWLSKDFVLITHPDHPIERTAKGTAQRRPTLASYEKEIGAMYVDATISV